MNFKTVRPAKILFGLVLAATLSHAAPGNDAVTRYQGSPHGSKVRVEGTSTVHDWEMEGTLIGGFIEFPAGLKVNQAIDIIPGVKDGKLPVKAQASISVRSVTSNKPIMDGLMQETLKEPQFKRIEYKLSELKVKQPHEAGKPLECDTAGELTIAGVTNKVSFPVTIEQTGVDRIKVSGTTALKMTAYGIKPPAPDIGLGLMKCGDDLKIVFEWALSEKK